MRVRVSRQEALRIDAAQSTAPTRGTAGMLRVSWSLSIRTTNERGRSDDATIRDSARNLAGFLWLLLPLGSFAVFWDGAETAGLVVGFLCFFLSPLLGGLVMLAKGRSVRAGLLVGVFAPILGQLALLALEDRRR